MISSVYKGISAPKCMLSNGLQRQPGSRNRLLCFITNR